MKRKQSEHDDDAKACSLLQFYSKSKDIDDLPSLGIADWRKRLSNFWPCEIDVGGKKYPSVEHAFHALKALHCSDKPTMAVDFECGGRVGSNPQNAKTAGGKGAYKKVGATLDLAKWDAQRDDATMIALRARVACDAEFCAILRATAGQYLLHFERQAAKAYWGGAVSASTGKVVGRNRLGEMLMGLRQELLDVGTTTAITEKVPKSTSATSA